MKLQTYLDGLRIAKNTSLLVTAFVIFSGCSQRHTDLNSQSVMGGMSTLGVMTKELLDANALLKADPNNKLKLDLLTDKAQERMSVLLGAVEKDPSSLLDVAFSKKIRDSFPDSAKEYLEEELHDIQGTLGVICAIQEDNSHQDHYVLTRDDGKQFSLHLKQSTQGHHSGTNVKIPSAFNLPDSGGINHLIVADMKQGETSEGSEMVVASYVPQYPTTGVFKTLMILANFQDQAQPWTPDSIKSVGQSVSNFNYENSFRKTTLPVTVVGPYTIPSDSTTVTCNLSTITSLINPLLKSAGIDTSVYDRRVYITPRFSSCGGTVGWGYVGGGKTWGITWVGIPSLLIIAHELGHNFGLQHSNARNCGATTIGSSCSSSAYADLIDTMGNRRPAHFNAAQKEALGWLNQSGFPSITSALSSGNYTIEPYESYSMNPKAIRLPKSPDALNSKYYYLEYRQPIGFDNIGFPGNLYQGVTLHQGSGDVSSSYSYLLNMTPTDTSLSHAAISGTNIFKDPDAPGGGISVSLNSATSSGASVSVKFGGIQPTCTRANPTWSVSPNTVQWVSPGAGASYTLTLRNNDSSACSNSTYQLMTTPASGVTAALSGSSLSLAPAATGNIILQVQSAVSTGSGTYAVQVKATNMNASSFTATVSSSLGVQSPTVIDTQAPSAPSNASASLRTVVSGKGKGKKSITTTYVQVAWNASKDNVGVAKYVISRNGAVLASVTTLSYSDNTTVAGGGTYTYRVVAYDAAGNASSPSNLASVTR